MSESTDKTPRPQKKERAKKRRSPLLMTIVVVAVLIAAFVGLSQVYTDWLWFDQLGYSTVFTTQILLKAAVFVVAALVVALPLWASMTYAVRHADVLPATREQNAKDEAGPNQSVPTSASDATEQMLRDVFGQQRAEDSMRRYHESVDKVRKLLLIAVPLLLGLFIASATMSQWSTVALFFNQQSFGKTDPEFGLDYGFFVFVLPFLRVVVSLVTSSVALAAVAGLFMHYFYGGIKVQPGGVTTTHAFRRHAAVCSDPRGELLAGPLLVHPAAGRTLGRRHVHGRERIHSRERHLGGFGVAGVVHVHCCRGEESLASAAD